jgi:sugar lactone lactonase YvrE
MRKEEDCPMNRNQPRSQSIFLLLAVLFGALIGIAGCSSKLPLNGNLSSASTSAELAGRLMGGQSPITGATIQLYAAGTTGYGSGAQALLSPALTSDENGDFDIVPSDYRCPTASTPTYIVASGGDPGLGQNNPAITLMAALGACGELTSIPFVNVNEATTVASVWALAQFMGYGAQIGTSSGNAQGLTNAFASVNNITDITMGISPGPQAPSGATVPAAKIYTLANILAACVNSTGTSTCDSLFSLATPASGTAPTNTLDAALDIAWNPSNNAASLFGLAGAQPPFEPSLSAAPNDWMIAVTFDGGGPDYPTSIALDGSGNVWASNYCSDSSECGSVTELSNTGQPISPSTGFANGSLCESYGLAVDAYNNVFIADQQTTCASGSSGNVTELNSSGETVSPPGGYDGGGIYFPVAAATDTDGSIWIANQGDSSASKLTDNGVTISSSGPFGSGSLSGPSAVAVDASHRAWFADETSSSGAVNSISSDGSVVNQYFSGGSEPSGIATDGVGVSSGTSLGHVWVANYDTVSPETPGSVSELTLNNDGTVTVTSTGYTGGGLNHPNGIAVDGAGNVWLANYEGNTLTELQGANGAGPGQPLSPSSGYGVNAGLQLPYGIAIDSSGNIWASNYGASTITEFIGAAAPVKTPLVGPSQLP